jgi:hypothetical protein
MHFFFNKVCLFSSGSSCVVLICFMPIEVE